MPPSSWLTASAWESLALGLSGSAKLNAATLTGSLRRAGARAPGSTTSRRRSRVAEPPTARAVGRCRLRGRRVLGVGCLVADQDDGLLALVALDDEDGGVLLGRAALGDQRDGQVLAGLELHRRRGDLRRGRGLRARGRDGRRDQARGRQERAVVARAHRLVLPGRPPRPREQAGQARRRPGRARRAARAARRSRPPPLVATVFAMRWPIRSAPITGRVEREQPHDRRHHAERALVGHRVDDVRSAPPRRRRELGQQEDRAERHADQDRHDHQHPER